MIAEVDGEFAGIAFCRLFDDENHGDGYVDERTPELAVAVVAEHRGAGIGAGLLGDLAARARASGFEGLSLSVDAENPARRLYRRLGYREIVLDHRGVLMVLDL